MQRKIKVKNVGKFKYVLVAKDVSKKDRRVPSFSVPCMPESYDMLCTLSNRVFMYVPPCSRVSTTCMLPNEYHCELYDLCM